jgi:hypothetical protein
LSYGFDAGSLLEGFLLGVRSFGRRLLLRGKSPASQAVVNPWVGVDGGNGFGAKKLLRLSADSQFSSPPIADGAVLHDVQVLTRYCARESPYWSAFLEHYASLGVKYVHVCVQNEVDYRAVVGGYIPDGLQLICHRMRGDLDPSSAFRLFDLSAIAEWAAFTLLVDCDEYFQSFRPELSLGRLFHAFPSVGQFHLPWLMAPVLDQLQSVDFGFWGHIGKPAARSSRMFAIANDHAFCLDRDDVDARIDSAPIGLFGFSIVHFWSRSFRDCLLKTFNNRLQDSKSADLVIALQKIRSGDLPNRLKLLAFLCSQSKFVPVSTFPSRQISWDEEEALLRACLSETDENICRQTFDRYCRQLQESSCVLPLYPGIALKTAVESMPTVLP